MKASLRSTCSFALPLCLLWIGLANLSGARAASFVTNGPLMTPRYAHTATLLQNGKVLVAGGTTNNLSWLASAELYDPATGTWTNTGAMNLARRDHTATLLQNGKVLVAGGGWDVNANSFDSAELYDPLTGTWTNTGALTIHRAMHTATLLPDGRVLVAGGTTGNIYLSSAEIYDPMTRTWTALAVTNVMSDQRFLHTAALLPDGKVYVAGGAGGIIKSSADRFDPSTGNFTATGPMQASRCFHTATLLPNGLVLITGGGVPANTQPSASTVELYDPGSGTSAYANSMTVGRQWHTATLLPNGQVLVAGGYDGTNALRSIELFDSTNGTWTMTANGLNAARYSHTATLLANGKVLIAGGSNGTNALSSTGVYDYASGFWTNTGSLNKKRDRHTATQLPNGKVLVAGGTDLVGRIAITELYNPTTGAWTTTNPLLTPRTDHTATLLADGRVLIAGGESDTNLVADAELYDPFSTSWVSTGTLIIPCMNHTATLLPNGQVLVAGGSSVTTNFFIFDLTSAELYDPSAGTWKITGSLKNQREWSQAALLANGKVLVAGGYTFDPTNLTDIYLASAELYDPATEMWTETGSMTTPRQFHTMTLLPNGKVLVTGGTTNGYNMLSSAELYDPVSGSWTTTGQMSTNRVHHTAVLLPNGKVLVTGGDGPINPGPLASTDLYDPVTETWTATGTLNIARAGQTATLLPSGNVMVVGGASTSSDVISLAEVYDVGLGFRNNWQPQIAAAGSPLSLNGNLLLTGSRFRGIAGGSGGTSQDSSTDYPVVQLHSIEGNHTLFLLTTNWSTNSFTSLPVWNFPPGWALVTVFVNGIQSASSIVNISVPVPTPPLLAGPGKLSDGSFQFSFTNSVGAIFGVFASTNLSMPLSNWTALGGATEISPGQFQFTDPQTTNNPRRFFGVRAP